MKKIIGKFFVLCGLATVLASCASSPKPNISDASGKVEIIEHKGTAWGTPQPSWVATVIEKSSDQKSLGKALGITGKKIWVLTKKGPNLDFLKTWVDQVDARADIAASIDQSVIDFVKGQEFGSKEEMQQEVEHVSGRFAMTRLNGLVRETDWWSRTRQMPLGSEEYTTQYNYMVIYSMDEEMFEKHIKDAYKDVSRKELMEGILINLMSNSQVEAQ